MLSPEQISRFYAGWEVAPSWLRLWAKQFRIRTLGDTFITLNRKRRRLDNRSLRDFCVDYAPVNVYMSVLNWLMPERVSDKPSSRAAYPTGGEYVVDVDSYLCYRKHSHRLVASASGSGTWWRIASTTRRTSGTQRSGSGRSPSSR